jgi:hypothetical protein
VPALIVESGQTPFPPSAPRDLVSASTSNARHQVLRSASRESFAHAMNAQIGLIGLNAMDWAQSVREGA